MDFSDYARLCREEPEGHYAEIGDIRMHYLREGRGAPLLLLHGGLGAAGGWRPLIDALTGFDIIAPDSRGQGRTTDGDGPMTYGRMAADMVGLLDHLGIERAHFAGHSDGGCLALHLLVDYPDRVLTATLAGTPLHHDDYREGAVNWMRKAFDKMRAGDDPGGFRGTYEALNPNPARWPIVMEKLAATWLSQPMFTDQVLAVVIVPVLVIVNSGDGFLPREAFERAANLFPIAESVEVEGTHINIVEHPVDTARAIQAFTKRHRAT